MVNFLYKIFLIAFIFCVIIFFQGDLRLILAACLLGFVIQQLITCFSKKDEKNQKEHEELEESISDEKEWLANFSEKHNLINQKIGFPNDEQFSVLISLFQVRYSMILKFYNCIRNYQDEAIEGHWLKTFLKEYSFCPTRPYEEFSTDQLKKLEQNADKIFTENFNNRFSAPIFLYQHKTQKILLALHYWVFAPSKIVQILDGIATFGFYNEMISELINTYLEVERLTESGDFASIFIDVQQESKKVFKEKSISEKALIALMDASKIWNQIFKIFKISIIQRNNKNKNSHDDDLLKQLSALEHMEQHLCDAILQEGKKFDSLGGGIPYSETEKFFFSQAASNPFLNNYGL